MLRMRSDGVYPRTERVKNWTSPGQLRKSGQASSKITGLDLWVVPIHQPNHWTCAVVYLREKRVVYLDSLHARDVF